MKRKLLKQNGKFTAEGIFYKNNPFIHIKYITTGITLVALVVTIVVLLILAGITINYVLGNDSIFKKATEAKVKTEIANAREKIEIVLTSVQVEKRTNMKYNENEFLDTYILKEIKDAEIIGDVVIVDRYAFELDRSIPKLGEYIGKREDLVFPDLTVSVPVLAENFKTATFTIIAKEEQNGIHKIEVIQEGNVIEKYEYNNRKDEIVENYSVKQNGKYTIKAYSNLSAAQLVTVDGIIMSVEYSPNGNEEYKKEHSVKVIVKEKDEKVKSIKYQWLNTTAEPEESSFTESCSNNQIITGKGFTGIYYLWTLLETQSGKKNICRSEAFYFDNEGPTVTLTSVPVSESSFTLNVTANDEHSKIEKYEIYIENDLKETMKVEENEVYYTVSNLTIGMYNGFVIVEDKVGNQTKESFVAKTKLYMWEKWNSKSKNKYIQSKVIVYESQPNKDSSWTGAYRYTFDEEYGVFRLSQTETHSGPATYYTGGGETMYEFYRTTADIYGNYLVTKTKYSAVLNPNPTYIKGETYYGNIYSSDRNQYPDNGKGDNFWYIYRGIN